jgi:hypothetical protein
LSFSPDGTGGDVKSSEAEFCRSGTTPYIRAKKDQFILKRALSDITSRFSSAKTLIAAVSNSRMRN